MGMCMALQLFKMSESEALFAAAGYEDGTVAVWDADKPDSPIMSSRLHSEPIMALIIDPSGKGTYFCIMRLNIFKCPIRLAFVC